MRYLSRSFIFSPGRQGALLLFSLLISFGLGFYQADRGPVQASTSLEAPSPAPNPQPSPGAKSSDPSLDLTGPDLSSADLSSSDPSSMDGGDQELVKGQGQDKLASQPRLSFEKIEEINRISLEEGLFYRNLLDLDQAQIEALYQKACIWPEKALYDKDKRGVLEKEKKALLDRAQEARLQTGYAFSIRRDSIRLLPTDQAYYKSELDTFDRLQGTALYPGQVVYVARTSTDEAYHFVISSHYAGWIKEEALTFISPDRAQALSQAPPLYVLSDQTKGEIRRQGQAPVFIDLPLGTVLSSLPPFSSPSPLPSLSTPPLPSPSSSLIKGQTFVEDEKELQVFWPGQASLKLSKETVRPRPLALTEAAMRRQADALLGQAYDWGGKNQGRDCSALVQDLYASFGFYLPRDSKDQWAFSRRYWPKENKALAGLKSEEEKEAFIRRLPVGSLLFLPGHVMMVYEKTDQGVVVVHDATRYYEKKDQGLEAVDLMAVSLSDLSILDKEGRSYLSKISGLLPLEME